MFQFKLIFYNLHIKNYFICIYFVNILLIFISVNLKYVTQNLLVIIEGES